VQALPERVFDFLISDIKNSQGKKKLCVALCLLCVKNNTEFHEKDTENQIDKK
jgi:hypothetical protein